MSEPVLSAYPRPEWDHAPGRVVSLVPSITESLFQLGFGRSVVGITDYCTRPADKLTQITRVGGPKAPNAAVIRGLNPDVVIGSQEETERTVVEELAAAAVKVWLLFPKTVDDGLNMLRQFLALYHTDQPVMMINMLQVSVDYAAAAATAEPPVRYFCPIWMEQTDGPAWWMTFNQETYPHDVLRIFGGVNIFAGRKRRYPLAADLGTAEGEPAGERDTRYPRVTTEEVLAGQPEMILLPDDPFHFTEAHKQTVLQQFADTPAVRNKSVYFLDGSLLTWYGTRLAKALEVLPGFFSGS